MRSLQLLSTSAACILLLVNKCIISGTEQWLRACLFCLLTQGNSFCCSFTWQKGRDVNTGFSFAVLCLQCLAVLCYSYVKHWAPSTVAVLRLYQLFCCNQPAAGWICSGKTVLLTCFLPPMVSLLPCQQRTIHRSLRDVHCCHSAVCSNGWTGPFMGLWKLVGETGVIGLFHKVFVTIWPS